MATTIGNETNPIDLFNNLIQLDYDAIAAYEAAIDRLDNAEDKAKLTEFMADHQRHTQDLAGLVSSLGGTPSTEGDMKAMLTKGKVVLADLMGDKAILKAMKTNEDDTNTAYGRAAGRTDLPAGALPVIERNLEDESRHRAWIEQRIAALGG